MDIYNLIFGVKNVELRAAWSFMNHDEEQKNIFFRVLNLESYRMLPWAEFHIFPRT